jgi:NAD(P)-dependent dehydrogenase (short-subunit alcohol dehydrogenase family)
VLVTGAGDGIGRAVSLALARAGAEVILLGRTVRKLEAVHAEIEKLGAPEASIVPLDLERALAADYEAVADAVEKRYGRLDGLLHNAALLGALTPIEQYDVPLFMRVMHVNVTAEFVLTRQLLPLLRASKDAALLFTSSGVGNVGRAYWGAYSISKFAVEGMAQVLSQELETTSSVRVNVIDPGKVRTSMRRAAYPSEALESLPTAGVADRALPGLVGPGESRGHGAAFSGAGPLEDEDRRDSISSSVSWRNWPRDRLLSSAIAPSDTRRMRLTSTPWRSNSWRMSLPLAPRATTAYQRFEPSSSASLLVSDSIFMRVGRSIWPDCTPLTWSGPSCAFHAHVNSLGKLVDARCSFAASAPSEVTSSRPPSMPGMGLTAMKRLPAVRGRRSISAARSAVDSRSGSPGERLKMNTCAAAVARALIGRPSRRMSSAG